MIRENQRLTDVAQEERNDFHSMDYGGCSCHLSPPCNFCVHPGNPSNQDDFDECWEPECFVDRINHNLDAARKIIYAKIDNTKG